MQVAAKGDSPNSTAVNRPSTIRTVSNARPGKGVEQELARIRLEQQQQKAAREVIDAETDLLKVNCSVGNRNAATPLAAIKSSTNITPPGCRSSNAGRLELTGGRKRWANANGGADLPNWAADNRRR